MKSKKLLIGLIVAAFVGGAHFASAQPKANYQNNLVEIGPDNISGRIRSIVVDEADPNHTTLYAGGVAGGLFKKVGDANWQYIPYYNGNNEITLPISCMIQLPDNSLLIGTGEGFVELHGMNNDRMSPKGRGVYRFNPSDNSFQLLTPTNPITNSDWTFVNRMAVLEREVNGSNYYFIYAATDEGLFRWKISASNPSWTAQPSKIASGRFHDVVIISADNIAYASAPGKLYRIGNVTGESMPVDVTNSNSAFSTASRIELAANTSHERNNDGSYTHQTYLYAVVANANGMLEGVYLTHDQQNWTLLSTSTVKPFNTDNPGYLNASICINPRNYKEIYVGGATMWVGQGFVANSYYQWGKQTYSEAELNYGNYMGTVFSDTNFVHSGIHQIVSTWTVKDGDTTWVTYFATDGGVYRGVCYNRGDHVAWSFRSVNKGLNTVQFNHIAVSPDGSIIGGAVDNSCPFIQSRNSHNGGVSDSTWYDPNNNSIMNHVANIIWFGNGGGVASSMFQQLKPRSRRALFVSSEPGTFYTTNNREEPIPVASFGRASADYSDYTNTQTWSVGSAFVSKSVSNSDPIPRMDLWETTNNTIWNENITFTIDTGLTYYHNGEVVNLSGATVFEPGDSIVVASKPCFNYPFYYKFTETHPIRTTIYYKDTIYGTNNTIISIRDTFRYEYDLNITAHNPVVSRMVITGRNSTNNSGSVYFTVSPVDFSKIWDRDDDLSQINFQKMMWWPSLYDAPKGYSIADVAFSRDGESVFAVVSNDTSDKSFIIRIYDITKADVNDLALMKDQLGFMTLLRLTKFDTIYAADGNMFDRPVTSMYVDKRAGQDNILLTFGGFDNAAPNMAYIKNASNPATRTVSYLSVTNSENGMAVTDPVYSGLIECSTGAIYAGTEKGVFVAPSATSNSWQSFGAFNGVPVTSIVQQTNALPGVSYFVHDGVNIVKYLFAKTKYPNAIYFGTYGRGVFMDTTYVTDHVNEVCDSTEWVGINTVDNGENYMKIYPNPAVDMANVELGVINSGNAVIKIYDISGKLVHSESLGYLNTGMHSYTLDCQKFNHGIYLVNINIGKESATSKLIVR